MSQAREFSSELRSSTKTPRNTSAWLEGSTNSNDTSMVSEAYSNMLKIFIPLLVDEVIFKTHCKLLFVKFVFLLSASEKLFSN